MKIVSDFDGVATEIDKEAGRVSEIWESKLRDLNAVAPSDLEFLLDDVRKQMKDAPHRFGWWHSGRLSAFSNEDGFVWNIAISSYLDQYQGIAKSVSDQLGIAVKKSTGENIRALGQLSYFEMIKETANGVWKPMDPSAVRAYRELLNLGHEVVFVSNSSTERIKMLLSNEGLLDLVPAKQKLRVRGGANKFELGCLPVTHQFGEYIVDIDRPSYRKILSEEKPDVVVGDVFSLDLSLPLHFEEKKIITFLRRRSYTPEWSQKISGVQSVSDLAELVDYAEK